MMISVRQIEALFIEGFFMEPGNNKEYEEIGIDLLS